MAAGDKRDLTVLVLGRPGQHTRRYRINRRAIVLLVLAIPGVGLGIGYVLGNRRAAGTQAASMAAATSTVTYPAVAPAMPTPLPANTAPAAVLAAPAPVPAAAPTPEASAAGEPLLIGRDGQGQEVIEIHPFSTDGSPRTADFALLEAKMACGSGHSQTPDAALVRVLLEAQHNFDKPLVLLGGRCPAHDDHPDTAAHHRAGRAADIRVRGVSSDQLMSWLVKRGVGGAGRYRRAGYVHIDVRTGPHEQWEAEEPAVAKAEPRLAAQPNAPTAFDEARPVPTEIATPAPAPSTEAAVQDHASEAVEN